MNIQQHKYAAI